MYSISSAEAERFLTKSLMPVKYLTSDDSSVQYDVQESAITLEMTGNHWRVFLGALRKNQLNNINC